MFKKLFIFFKTKILGREMLLYCFISTNDKEKAVAFIAKQGAPDFAMVLRDPCLKTLKTNYRVFWSSKGRPLETKHSRKLQQGVRKCTFETLKTEIGAKNL